MHADPVDLDLVQDEFRRLVRDCHQEGSPRIIVASDDSGRGKSTLLRKLHYVGAYYDDVPCALIALDEIEEGNEFELIEQLAEQLRRSPEVSFATFERLNAARHMRQTGFFLDSLRSMVGRVQMDRPVFQGGEQVVGGGFAAKHIERIEHLNLSVQGSDSWSEGHETEAKKACMEAFFSDLPSCCTEKPFVVLIDSVDRTAPPRLKDWVLQELIRNRLIRSLGRTSLWILVIAGQRDLDDVLRGGFLASYAGWIWPAPNSFDWWTEDHVKEFVKRHVGTEVVGPHLQYMTVLVKDERWPLNDVISLARHLTERGR